MTETKVKAVKETAIVRREAEPLVPDAENMSKVIKVLLASGMWPQFENEPQAWAAAEYGRELGLGPAMSLNSIFPVNGKLGIMTNVMLAVAKQTAGVTWKIEAMTPKGCIIVFSRPGFEPLKATFDESDAKAAGLLGKDNWRGYPTDMYFIRAAARGIRKIAPDAILGIYTVEELRDIAPDIMPAEGEVKEAEVVKEKVAEPVKKAKEKPKEEAKPRPEPTELDKTKGEIGLTLATLVEKFNHVPGELIEKIRARILKVFGRAVERIPEDLTEKEATIILNALKNTLDAEKAAAAKEEEEAEKGGAL
jgi:hypothetical protein